MENKYIREYAAGKGVYLWEAALEMGISQASMTRLLRIPVSTEKQDEVLTAIDRVAGRKELAK